MSCLEFNGGRRGFVGIKGRDGGVLINILTLAEQRGDKQINDAILAKLEICADGVGIQRSHTCISPELDGWRRKEVGQI